jgi:hypothetical protein
MKTRAVPSLMQVVALTAGLVALGCPSAAWSMTGGLPQHPEPGWSARVDFPGGWCSGELIAPTWIITAGHCTLHASASDIKVKIQGATISASNVFTAPGYKGAKVPVYPDVGLIELPTNAVQAHGASTLALASQDEVSYFESRGVTVFGYGREKDGRIPAIVNKSRDAAWIEARYCQVKHDSCFTLANWALGVTSVTEGDSGGAWVGWRDGGWHLLAVVSGFPGRDLPGLQAATSPASPGVAAWIASLVAPASRVPEGHGSQPPVPAEPSSLPTSLPLVPTYAETSGGMIHTWTDYVDAAGVQGPQIPPNDTVQIACKVSGFRVEDGNTWWYLVFSSPWDGTYYASADAFYNDGQVSGSLIGTPFVDPAVPTCSSSEAPAETEAPSQNAFAETSGGVVHTWSDYADAGGIEGPEIPSNDTVQIACKVSGFTVADGNTWWYRIASGPWNGDYYGSADAFYNNGATAGSLLGTPFVDPNIPNC